jgi:hypothetical protein
MVKSARIGSGCRQDGLEKGTGVGRTVCTSLISSDPLRLKAAVPLILLNQKQ